MRELGPYKQQYMREKDGLWVEMESLLSRIFDVELKHADSWASKANPCPRSPISA